LGLLIGPFTVPEHLAKPILRRIRADMAQFTLTTNLAEQGNPLSQQHRDTGDDQLIDQGGPSPWRF